MTKKVSKKTAAKKKASRKGVGGRPTKYRPEFCDVVIRVGEEGGWVSEMAEACDVHRSTFPEWEAAHPEFSAALTRAKQKAQAWFERTGRHGMVADKFNHSLWAKQMAARHPDEYSERRNVNLGADQSMKDVFESISKGANVLDLARER